MIPNYRAQLPRYRYELPCGASVYYSTPVPVGEFGYCKQHSHYFVNDGGLTVREYPPTDSASRRIPDMTIAQREDEAILRSRVAQLLEEVYDGDELEIETLGIVAEVTETSLRTVQRVVSDMGLAGRAL